MIPYRPTIDECAALLNELMRAHGLQRGKAITRGRVSLKTLRRVCGRRALRERFIEDLATALLDWGWILVVGPGERYGLLAGTSLEGWPRVTSSSITTLLSEVRRGNFDFASLESEFEDETDDVG